MEPRVAATAPVLASRPTASHPRRDLRVRRHLSTVLLAIVLAADAAAIVLIRAMTAVGSDQAPAPTVLALLIVTASYGIVGWIIASRQPENRIGWVFLIIGLSLSIEASATQYAVFGLVVSPGSLPFADLASWVAVWAWAPGFTFLVSLSVLLFPDGRPPSDRWRPVVWASFVMMALLLFPMAIASWSYRGLAALNTDKIDSQAIAVATGIQLLGVVMGLFVAAASGAGMITRFRHAGGIERQQLKWFVFAAVAVMAFVLTISLATPPPILATVASILIAPLVPAAAAVAILRYRLYDLDRLVSRTISYGIVTGTLVVIFGTAIVVFQTALEPLTGRNGVAVAASTLLVVALFQPLRRRIQGRVDRRFNRGRYDAEQVVAAFASRLREDVDLESLGAHISATVVRTVQPASVSVWLARDETRIGAR
jgi:hypothetical protein